MSMSWFLEPVRMMGSWQRVIMSTDKVVDNLTLGRLFWILHVGPVYSQGSLKGKEGNKIKLGERAVGWEEFSLMLLALKMEEGAGTPTPRSWKRRGNRFSTSAFSHKDEALGTSWLLPRETHFRLWLQELEDEQLVLSLSHQVCSNLLQKQKENNRIQE